MSVDQEYFSQASPLAPVAAPPQAPVRASRIKWLQQMLTGLIVFGPLVALVLVVKGILGGAPVPWPALVIAVPLYLLIGHGVTIGFHRLFTHHAFEARRPLKVVLAVLGSMSFQGSLIGWVAEHRRHHMFSDRAGDPHSPVRSSSQRFARLRGLYHAHVGWFFKHEETSRQKYASDLLADRDLVLVDRLFVPLCVVTLLIPFLLGLAIGGSWGAAFTALLWAGILRIGFLHHVTWSTNSICHTFGSRPFRTRDASTNVAPLALLSMGESWHNAHHAFPTLARHGVDRGQIDSSAGLIRLFERFGWATKVRWPDAALLEARRVRHGDGVARTTR